MCLRDFVLRDFEIEPLKSPRVVGDTENDGALKEFSAGRFERAY